MPPLRCTHHMKIAIFTESFLPNIDGVVNIVCLVLKGLHERGHQVLLIGPEGGPNEYAGAEVVAVGGPPLPIYPELHISLPHHQVWERVRAFQPDIIHLVSPFFLGPFGAICARRLHVPLLASFQTNVPHYARYYGGPLVGGAFFEPLTWAFLHALHNQAHVNLCPSTETLRDLRAHGFKRVRWWPHGIDIERFSPGPTDPAVRKRLSGGRPDDLLVLYAGRLAPEKRLEIIRDSLFAVPGVRLSMVGDGPSHEQLRRHFSNTPTTFPGFLRGDDLVAAYRAADVFLFPSTTETFGLVALEAMACRLPVIAARAGGVLDIVRDGENGMFFEPDQPAQIGALVRCLRDDPGLRERLAAGALAHARTCSWQKMVGQLIDYYDLARRVSRRT